MTEPSFIYAIAPMVVEREELILLLVAVLARMSAIVILAPGFGEHTLPIRVRLMIVFALVAVAAPAVEKTGGALTEAQAVELIGAEFANGFVIGFSLRAVVFILNITGAIIAQHMSLTQLFGVSVLADHESALASMLVMALLAAGASLGLHIEIAALAARTFDILPYGEWPAGSDVAGWSTQKAGTILNIAFSLSLPFVIFGLAYSLAIAAATRAMPQLSAVFVGLPASIFAGLILFAATALIVIDRATQIFSGAIETAPWGLR